MTDPDARHLTWPTWVRLMFAAYSLLCWTLGLWVCLLWLLQTVVLPDWKPPDRAAMAAVVAFPVGTIVSARGSLRRIYSVILCPEMIELRRGNGIEHVRPAEVLGLIGLGGISLDGGELVVWKQMVILTEFARHTLTFDKDENEWLYRTLREYCPLAWGIPYPGDLEPPGKLDGSIMEQQAQLTLGRIGSYYRRQILRSLAISLTLVGGSVVAFLGAFWFTNFDTSVLKGLAWLIVFAIAGVSRLAGIRSDLAVLRKIRRAEMSW